MKVVGRKSEDMPLLGEISVISNQQGIDALGLAKLSL